MRDGADVLGTTRPEAGTAKSDGKVTYRNGFVTDLDITHRNVTETAACGRTRRRIGNGISNLPGTDGYDPGRDFRHWRGDPANPPVVPDPPAFAAHTACGLGEAARQRAHWIPGARKHLSWHMHTHAVHAVLPSWAGPVATPANPQPAIQIP